MFFLNTVVVVEIDVPDTPPVFFFYSPYRFLQSEFFENSDWQTCYGSQHRIWAWRVALFCLGVTEQPTKAPLFYLVGCAAKFFDNKRADEL